MKVLIPKRSIVVAQDRALSRYRGHLSPFFVFALSLLLALVSCSSAAAQPKPETASASRLSDGTAISTDTRYRIGPGDVLQIFVRKAPELSIEAVRVDQRGMIKIPMIDDAVRSEEHT